MSILQLYLPKYCRQNLVVDTKRIYKHLGKRAIIAKVIACLARPGEPFNIVCIKIPIYMNMSQFSNRSNRLWLNNILFSVCRLSYVIDIIARVRGMKYDCGSDKFLYRKNQTFWEFDNLADAVHSFLAFCLFETLLHFN